MDFLRQNGSRLCGGDIMRNSKQAETPVILALDLGARTGWAFSPTSGVIISSSWDLSPGRGADAIRYQLLKNTLEEFWFLNEAKNFEVLYQQAHRIPGTQACRAELQRHLKAWCRERDIIPQAVGVGQIKKFWTRRGNVTKEDMVAEARARGFDPVDGNEAIALALLHWRVILGSSDDVALAA
jgi:hypothetical protein